MLQKAAIKSDTLELLRTLQADDVLINFHLAGGTGLALQLGHRVSVDLDMFSPEPFNTDEILNHIEEKYSFTLDAQGKNTLNGTIQNIKVDWITHNYPLLEPILILDSLRIYSLPDIAAMKVNAITTNGTRSKDFVDIYFLLRHFTIGEMLVFYEKKYLHRNSFQALKSLNYFGDVDLSDWPLFISEPELTWETVKHTIDEACIHYLN